MMKPSSAALGHHDIWRRRGARRGPLLAQIGLAERIVTKVRRTRRGKKVTVDRTRLKPLLRFHDLRHTAATLVLEQGTHPAVVAAMLGHSKTSTTLNVYSHVVPSIMGAAAKAIEDILSCFQLGSEFGVKQGPLRRTSAVLFLGALFIWYWVVPRGRIELPTPAFSVLCSTN